MLLTLSALSGLGVWVSVGVYQKNKLSPSIKQFRTRHLPVNLQDLVIIAAISFESENTLYLFALSSLYNF